MNLIMIASLVIVIGIIIGLVVLVAKTKTNRMARRKKYNRVRVILGGYVTILIISTVLVMILPDKDLAGLKTVRSEDLQKESTELYNAASKGWINQLDSGFLYKSWKFNFPDKQLNVEFATDQFLGTQIFVERKKTNDNQIEALFYKTRTSVDGMDITRLTKPIGLELAGKTLTILNPQKITLKFSMFNNVFPVNQFTGENSLFNHESSFSEGMSILYLRIPKDLNLVDQSNLHFEIVQ